MGGNHLLKHKNYSQMASETMVDAQRAKTGVDVQLSRAEENPNDQVGRVPPPPQQINSLASNDEQQFECDENQIDLFASEMQLNSERSGALVDLTLGPYPEFKKNE